MLSSDWEGKNKFRGTFSAGLLPGHGGGSSAIGGDVDWQASRFWLLTSCAIFSRSESMSVRIIHAVAAESGVRGLSESGKLTSRSVS